MDHKRREEEGEEHSSTLIQKLLYLFAPMNNTLDALVHGW